MDALYDANVWLALAFASHPHAAIALRHFAQRDAENPAVFCRATQQSFLRLVTTSAIQQAYGSGVITNVVAWSKAQGLLELPQIQWRNEPEALTELWGNLAGLDSASPKVWMDAYLAVFAILHEIEFVTLDRDFKRFETAGLKLRLLIE